MKQTYIIDGMTCGGCKASVEKHLLDLKEISEVEITLKNKEVVFQQKPYNHHKSSHQLYMFAS